MYVVVKIVFFFTVAEIPELVSDRDLAEGFYIARSEEEKVRQRSVVCSIVVDDNREKPPVSYQNRKMVLSCFERGLKRPLESRRTRVCIDGVGFLIPGLGRSVLITKR